MQDYNAGMVMGGSGSVSSAAPLGGSLNDLVSTNKGGVLNLANLAQTVATALPPELANAIINVLAGPTSSASPILTGINNLGTTAISVIGSSSTRFAMLLHNPGGTASVYVFPTPATTAPTLASTGGAFVLYPGGTLPLGPLMFANVNAAFSAFAGTGTNNPLTIWEFL